jgi:prepilin-type N-terminal cleavage/methylation domain-containing protein
MRRRRGFTLIEVIVVMMAGALVLGLCVGLIHLLVGLDRAGRAHMNERTAVARLAQTFRDDVRAAVAAEPAAGAGGPGRRLVLKRPDGREVEYLVEEGAVLRAEREGEKVRHRDTFRLSRREAARLDVQPSEGLTVVALGFEARADRKDKGAYHAYRVESVLGQDHRFEAREE